MQSGFRLALWLLISSPWSGSRERGPDSGSASVPDMRSPSARRCSSGRWSGSTSGVTLTTRRRARGSTRGLSKAPSLCRSWRSSASHSRSSPSHPRKPLVSLALVFVLTIEITTSYVRTALVALILLVLVYIFVAVRRRRVTAFVLAGAFGVTGLVVQERLATRFSDLSLLTSGEAGGGLEPRRALDRQLGGDHLVAADDSRRGRGRSEPGRLGGGRRALCRRTQRSLEFSPPAGCSSSRRTSYSSLGRSRASGRSITIEHNRVERAP